MEVWRPRPSGFIEMFMRQRGAESFGVSDVFNAIDRLEQEHLDFFAIISISQLLQNSFPMDQAVVYVTRNVAIGIIRHFLGAQWVIDNALTAPKNPSPQVKKGRAFFKSDYPNDAESQHRWHFRIMRLAESLYNFQNVPGIRQRMNLIKNDDLESAHGEFLCAKLFASPVFELRFVEPQGIKGCDYDCEFTAPGGLILHGEIKTKSEITNHGQKNIYNTLEHARRQLPATLPGVIFLKLPEGWIKELDSTTVIREGLNKVMRQSNRLVAVALIWEEWLPIGDSRVTHLQHQVIGNPRSSFYSDDVVRCFQLAKAAALKNDGWFWLEPYVARHYSSMRDFAVKNLQSDGDSPKQ